MLRKDNIDNKIYLVIGLGKSGLWVSKLLNLIGKKVIVFEENDNIELQKYKTDLERIGINVFLNKPFEYREIIPLLNDLKYVVLSPAINLDNKNVIKLKKEGIGIIGEINIGWEYLGDLNLVGITGTNGKSTVTDLLSHVLCQNNLFAPSAGNIGTPISKYAYDIQNNKKIDWLITELSSYQIEIASDLKPKIGIWTTFTSDHLDRHKTMENYFNIKNNLLRKSNFRIYNYDDEYLRKSFNKLSKGIWVTSDIKNLHNNLCDYCIDKEGFIVERGTRLFNSNLYNLKGNHNIQNLLLTTAAARKIGLSGTDIGKTLKSYNQLPHRLELIYKNNVLEIINDSKATNFESSIAGINSFKNDQIIIAGGRLKDGDHNEWIKTLKIKCHSIFLYGESVNELKKLLLNGGFHKPIFTFSNLSELVKVALNYTQSEKVKTLLFSPSCSSFDQFQNYEERGDLFKSLINKSLLD